MAHWAATGHADGDAYLEHFRNQKAIRLWLGTVSYRRHNEAIALLLDRADDWVNHDAQRQLVAETYASQLERGLASAMAPTRRALHQAAFTIAYSRGAPALASLRFLALTAFVQSDVTASPAAVRKQMANLQASGVLTYTPGERSSIQSRSGTVTLELVTGASQRLVNEARTLLEPSPELLLEWRQFLDTAGGGRAKERELRASQRDRLRRAEAQLLHDAAVASMRDFEF
ncbi:hypothetical protein [Nocardioides alkalitolerans]|uniref:hypothetical protein n=1 Tax=Nocardioides alkalitolerans TaxID=281714 RepID=UPI0012FB0AB2|nr:hypothetical protein [Nocardioides alkalitolerans]